jgi:hypothetical protein
MRLAAYQLPVASGLLYCSAHPSESNYDEPSHASQPADHTILRQRCQVLASGRLSRFIPDHYETLACCSSVSTFLCTCEYHNLHVFHTLFSVLVDQSALHGSSRLITTQSSTAIGLPDKIATSSSETDRAAFSFPERIRTRNSLLSTMLACSVEKHSRSAAFK